MGLLLSLQKEADVLTLSIDYYLALSSFYNLAVNTAGDEIRTHDVLPGKLLNCGLTIDVHRVHTFL